ncbi:MFS transporter [Celerinatantimonas sp. YJH-8]|uniref:MFS transporter n=1 Tax=Celerinatantimonas sp. YJH-8 TaxID=3228714 RepID=UPI0038C7D91D
MLLIVFFGISVSLLSTSIKTSYQVFFVSMSDSFQLSRGEFALSGTLFMAVFGISSPIVGYIADRLGAKKTIIGGIFISGLFFLLMAVAQHFISFLFIYGIGAAFAYTAISFVSLAVLVDEINAPKIKGFLYALVTNGAALGFVFLAPLWLYLNQFTSWRTIYIGIGLIFMIPLTLLAIFVMRAVDLSGAESADTTQSTEPMPSHFGERLKQVFTNRYFYYLAIAFSGCGITMAYIDIHFVAQLKDLGLSSGFIGMSLAILGVTEFVGGLIAGVLCDRYSKRLVLSGFYLLRAIGVFILLIQSNQLGVLLFVSIFGISYMGTVIGTSAVSLHIFRKDIRGFAFGFIWLFHQIGAAVATQLGADLYDLEGNYQLMLLITGIFALVSALLASRIKLRDHPQVEHAAATCTSVPSE